MTSIVPVFDGYALPHLTKRFPIAGHELTQNLAKLLLQKGVPSSVLTKEVLRAIKEKFCFVS